MALVLSAAMLAGSVLAGQQVHAAEAGSVPVDPAITDSANTDPETGNPAITDSTNADPDVLDSTNTNPANTDSTNSDPVVSDSANSDPVVSDSTNSDPVVSDSPNTDPVTMDPTNPMTGQTVSGNGFLQVGGGVWSSGTSYALLDAARDGDYNSFTTDQTIANLNFGTDVTASPFDGNMGFYDITWPAEAKGWDGGVYYPRESTRTVGASFVQAGTGCLAVGSKVWTETESTGYGVYTYEETSSFDMDVANADYSVSVTLTNPTGTEYTAYLEAEDITKETGIQVAPGASVTRELTAVVVDGELSLKFLSDSGATTKDSAALQNVYVSNVTVTRLATNAAGQKPTVYLASDSTVQTYEDYYEPQTGWGETLANFFGGEVEERSADDCDYGQARVYEADNAIVENRAIGGRSSKSFVEEGKLDDLLEDIRPGDYLFVQWGHNDSTNSRPNRFVSVSEFGKWIQYYIDGALQRGATPVLVTPVARYSYSDKDNAFVGNFEAYGDVMRSMAAAQNVPLIDLTARSLAVCNAFGKEGAKSLFLMVEAGEYPGAYAGGANDSTHLQWYGAYKFSQCVAQGIQENGALSDLASKVVMNVPSNVPQKVTGLKSVTVGASSATLAWDPAEGAELYYIYRQALADGQTADSVDFSNAEKYSVSSKAGYTDSSCASGVTYVYAVRGFNEKGLGDFSDKVTVKTKAAGWKFDFNYKGSPTLEGWTGIGENFMYDEALGYGFTVPPNNGRDRGFQVPDAEGPLGAMGRDFMLGDSTFEVKVPNGDYEVTCYAGDLLKNGSTIKANFSAEGNSIGTVSARQSIGSMTATVRVTDGKLTIGNNGYMMGLTVTQVLAAPSGLTVTEGKVEGTSYSFLLGFVGVDEAVSYNVYRKGTTDKEFTLVKSFTVEEYRDKELDCKAQSVRLGDEYQYYMTCVTSIGAESAPSAICTVKAVLEGVPAPAAPQNVRCTAPAEGTTDLQRSVTIEWDPVAATTGTDGQPYNVILYNIYRSDKAEGEKGFKEFVKVGTVESGTSFTDDTVTTNIPWYYKVTAVNAGGEGEKSESCKTPVTGSLVAGGRESYSDRGLVAVNLSGGKGAQTLVSATGPDGSQLTQGVYLSWRAFEADMDGNHRLNTTFDVYCNGTPIATGIKETNLVYAGGTASDTFKVVGSNDGSIGVQSVDTQCWANQYLDLNLYCPGDETMPDGSTCSFSANDMTVGDLDGDGQLELIVKWYPSNAKDNSGSGYTGNTYLDGYDVNWATGQVSMMWRINLGINIRSGAHYTQFQVWDYDGDGKAEIAVKTGDGTTSYKSLDGTANSLEMNDYVGEASDQVLTISVNHGTGNFDYRASNGYIIIPEGHEYFSIFNGEDGTKAAADVPYEPFGGNATAWGDSSDGYRNRIDRFLSATAYLDGETPFAVFCRGYYTRTCLTAYYMKDTNGDGIGDTIDIYWKFDTKDAGSQYEAQGNHGLSVNDVDNDGRDEIIYGALTVDHDGTVKYCTGLGHGDAMHVSDWIPQNPGLEIMCVHEHDDAAYHVEIHDAETGEILMGYWTGRDTGRGVAADIDPTSVGAEWWAVAGPNWTPAEGEDEPSWDSTRGVVYSAASSLGNLISLADSTPASNFSIFWDGDLLSEVLDHKFNNKNGAYDPIGVIISKWNYETEEQETMLYSEEIWSNNGTKGNVGLAADILGDWREEIITRTSGNPNVVRVYTTTIQTDYVVPCLLEDLAYREGVAWQNVGYNQPANLSYLLSEGLVTSQLSEGEIGSEDAQVNFTKASDGTYGHEITGYQIYRKLAGSDGAYELVTTIPLDQLVESTGGGSTTPEIPEPKIDMIYEDDFESGAATIPYKVVGGTVEFGADKATKNQNTSDNIFAFHGNNGSGPRGAYIGELTNCNKDGLTVETDIRIDGGYQNGTDVFALLGDVRSKDNSLASTMQILTLTVTTGGTAGMIDQITVNGQDIKDKALVTTGNRNVPNEESSNWRGMQRDTTGWIHLRAEIDFTNQKVNVLLTRVSDDSEIFNQTVDFVNKDAGITELKSMYMSASRQWGTVSLDNVEIYTKEEVKPPTGGGDTSDVTTYVYTDTGLAAATAYSYKVAAVVATADGERSSFMSRALEIETADKINSVEALDPVTLYEDTPIDKGETVASLLPQTVEITTADGVKKDYQIKWNVTGLDIMTVGEYDVTGTIKGWKDPIPLHVTVAPNAVKGYVPFEDIKVVIGHEAVLPKEVEIEWLNTRKTKKAVTWDTSTLDTSKYGECIVTGTVAGTTDTVTIKVLVVENYITSVPKAYGEVAYYSDNVGAQLPSMITANFAAGDPKQVAVTWNADSISAIDTSTVGTYTIVGTVEGFDGEVTAEIRVEYKAVYKFDFGIDAKEAVEGWTTVTVNVKEGKKTSEQLGINYTEEKGYGFLDPASVIDGRSEEYTFNGVLPKLVYKDFVIPDGQTFVVDLPNGKYMVEVVSGSYLKSDVKAIVEGISVNVSNTAQTYTIKTINVEMTDGQLTCEFPSGHICRMDAIIVRLIEADKTALKAAIDNAEVLADSELLYTEETWAAFQAALAEAKKVYEHVYPDCEAVANATKALTDAQAALKLDPNGPDKVSIAALKKAIEAAKALEDKQSLYTEESWAVFAEKLKEAQAVLDKSDATNEEREAARAALQAAQAALVKKYTGEISGVVTPVITGLNVGMTLEELLAKLPVVVDVTFKDGTTGKAGVTWDVSKVDLDRAGVYDAFMIVDGWSEPILCRLTLTKKIAMDVEASGNMPAIKVPAISDEQLKNILSAEDLEKLANGAEIRLAIEAYGMQDADIEAPVLAALSSKLAQNGLNVIAKMNIDLVKYIDAETPQLITEANIEIPLVITIPEEFRNTESGYEREFFVVRTHVAGDGSVQTDVLEDQDQESSTITIMTNKFSVYALAYKDAPVQDNDDDDEEDDGQEPVVTTPTKTGDEMNVWVWIVLLAACIIGAASVFGVKIYRKKHHD